MSHNIIDHELPGIAAGRRARLEAAGLSTLEALVQAGVDGVSAVPHIPRAIAEKIVNAAQDHLLALASSPSPSTTTDPTPDPDGGLMVVMEMVPAMVVEDADGERVDRVVEKSARLLKEAARHARKGPRAEARKARKEFGRLRTTLKGLRRAAAAGELPAEGWYALQDALRDLNGSLKKLLKDTPKPRALRKTRKRARHLRQHIQP